jgi:hypothetical protein
LKERSVVMDTLSSMICVSPRDNENQLSAQASARNRPEVVSTGEQALDSNRASSSDLMTAL